MSISMLAATNIEWLDSLTAAIDDILTPLMIIACSAGAVYAIVLGIKMAQADSKDKREEFKKQLINIVIAIVSVIALIVLFNFVSDNIATWLNYRID